MTYFARQIFDHKNKVRSHAYRPGEYFGRCQGEAIANEHQSDENDVEECNVDQALAPPISSTHSTSRHPNSNSQKTAKRKAKLNNVCTCAKLWRAKIGHDNNRIKNGGVFKLLRISPRFSHLPFKTA